MFISKTTAVVLAMAGGMFVSTLAAQADTWYVDHANGCPGTGFEGDPFCLIQDGIDAAVDYDEVVVADGTYTGDGNRDLDFGGRLITLRCAGEPGTCVIDCENSGRGFSFTSGETEEAEVDGFTITGGNHTNGGGMYCSTSSSPTVTNCTFDGNSATNGGGVFCSSSSPTISDCTFTENIATGSASQFTGNGGAINLLASSPTIEDCTFTRNIADGATSSNTGNGGGIFCRLGGNPVIENCTFIDNEAFGGSFFNSGGFGGGLVIAETSNAILRNCTFVGNAGIVGTASNTGGGGGIFVFGSAAEFTNCKIIGNKAIGGASPLDSTGTGGGFTMAAFGTSSLTKCIIAGNSATGDGVNNGLGGGLLAIDPVQLVNCAVIGNGATFNGGGVFSTNTDGGPATIVEVSNSTVSDNSAGNIGGGIFSTTSFGPGVTTFVDNSIVWGNVPNQIVDELDAVTTVNYSDVQGGWLGGTGNISADPLFVGGPSGTWTADGDYDQDAGQTTLTDANAAWGIDTLVGMFINPDTDQTLQSLIVANTATTVTVWADFSELGTTDTDYEIRNYHFMAGSPVIDAADNAAVPEGIETDLDGNPRFVDDPLTPDCPQAPGTCGDCPVVDMGAYEFQEGVTDCCPADFDDDGAVGASDLAELLGSWGPCDDCDDCPADFNDDCAVNAADLAQLLGSWGPCQ